MIENNFFKKNSEEDLINKFGLKNTSVEYSDSNAISYVSSLVTHGESV